MTSKMGLSLCLGFLALAACREEDGPPIDVEAAARGQALAQDCTACHIIGRRDNLVGPHLVNVYGRQVASVSNFEYSEVLAAQDFKWDSETLAAYILDPTGTYPGTMMAYDGLTEAQAADVAEYFRSLAQN